MGVQRAEMTEYFLWWRATLTSWRCEPASFCLISWIGCRSLSDSERLPSVSTSARLMVGDAVSDERLAVCLSCALAKRGVETDERTTGGACKDTWHTCSRNLGSVETHGLDGLSRLDLRRGEAPRCDCRTAGSDLSPSAGPAQLGCI